MTQMGVMPPPNAFRAIRYLGNKRKLAERIRDAIDDADSTGYDVLDLFAGTCSVSYHLKESHRVLSNDNQLYYFEIAKALIENEKDMPTASEAEIELGEAFRAHAEGLANRLRNHLEIESSLLYAEPDRTSTLSAYREFCNQTPYVGNWRWSDEFSRIVHFAVSFRDRRNGSDPWTLFTCYFANTYFGLQQCIEIDAIRRAITLSADDGAGWRRHVYLAALLYVLSQHVSSPGHFAEYLKPMSATTLERIQLERRKQIWAGFLQNVSLVSSLVRRTKWHHIATSENWDVTLAKYGSSSSRAPGVVYADPPYTEEHYSRYYHVLETLVRYDYPKCERTGRYRDCRFASLFSLRSKARGEFERMIGLAAAHRSALVISYSNRGVLDTRTILSLCRRRYSRVRYSALLHKHSLQGRTSTGKGDNVRREYIITCTKPT